MFANILSLTRCRFNEYLSRSAEPSRRREGKEKKPGPMLALPERA
jgi:hypothetical protein